MTLIMNRPTQGCSVVREYPPIVIVDDLRSLTRPHPALSRCPGSRLTPANVYNLGDARREQTLYATVLHTP